MRTVFCHKVNPSLGLVIITGKLALLGCSVLCVNFVIHGLGLMHQLANNRHQEPAHLALTASLLEEISFIKTPLLNFQGILNLVSLALRFRPPV